MSEEKSTKPREMVHRAQADATKWLHQLRRARQGVPNAPSIDRARCEFHDSVMAYWEQIKRFRGREHIQSQWTEEEISALGGTLADLKHLRLGTESYQTKEEDPDTRLTKTVTRTEPWTMQPQTAMQVFDKLDDCAHELGFDAAPERRADTTGAGAVDVDDPEEMDHINADPVGVAVDGDD